MRWLVGGNVFDVEKGSFQRADIGIEGERIAAITPQAKPDRKDDIYEMPGAWLLPGLIDCHVHLTIPTELADPGRRGQSDRRRGRALHGEGGGADAAGRRDHGAGRGRLELCGDGGARCHQSGVGDRAAAVPRRPAAVDHHRHGRLLSRHVRGGRRAGCGAAGRAQAARQGRRPDQGDGHRRDALVGERGCARHPVSRWRN